MANIRLELPLSADIAQRMLNRPSSVHYEFLLEAETIELSIAPPDPGFDPREHWRRVQPHLKDFMDWWRRDRQKDSQLVVFLDVWWKFVAECNGLPTFQMLSEWVVEEASRAWITLQYDHEGVIGVLTSGQRFASTRDERESLVATYSMMRALGLL